MTDTFKEKWEAAVEEYNKPKLYKIKKAAKLLGFADTEMLTIWLRDNYFIDWEDLPAGYLIRNEWMNYDSKTTYFEPIYDSCDKILNGSEYVIGEPIKYRNIPLITGLGVVYFGLLLSDDEQLKEVIAEIKLDNLEKLKYANF